jgi:hypothetical protein
MKNHKLIFALSLMFGLNTFALPEQQLGTRTDGCQAVIRGRTKMSDSFKVSGCLERSAFGDFARPILSFLNGLT